MPSALFVTTVPVTLEAFLVPFADHFRAQGWHVDAAARAASSERALDGHFDRVFDVPWSRDPLDPSNLLTAATRIREIVREGGYDIVHVHTPVAAFVTRFALRSLRRGPGPRPAVIYTAHGFHFFAGQPPLPHAVYRTVERIAAPWTDRLVVVNDEDLAAARLFTGLRPDQVRLIRGIGVDTERFSPAAVPASEAEQVRREIDVRAGAFLLTMVAELAPVKRHALALEALARVADPSVVLALVGDGPLESDLRALVAAKGLDDRVRFAGYRRDVPAVLAASDALLLVSEREGLNRSALEAMASGVPVIGTDTRGIADAIGDGAGWIVPKDDAAGLAAVIEEAASHPGEVALRGRAARKRALSEFSLDRVIDAYDGLYHETLASHL